MDVSSWFNTRHIITYDWWPMAWPLHQIMNTFHLAISYNMHPIAVMPSNFDGMFIPVLIQGCTLSPVIDDPAMGWPLHPVMNRCHLAIGCCRHLYLHRHGRAPSIHFLVHSTELVFENFNWENIPGLPCSDKGESNRTPLKAMPYSGLGTSLLDATLKIIVNLSPCVYHAHQWERGLIN